MTRGNLDRAFLKFKEFVLKTGRQAKLAQARARLGAEVIRDI